MATNLSNQFSSDIEAVIAAETLPLAQRQLVAYKFGDPERIPEGRGTTLTMTRYNRLPLPYAPLSEGVPPQSNQMAISQVTVQVQQWGGLVLMTDVAELTIKHPVVSEAKKLISLQSAETLERNTFNTFAGMTQVNYVNSRGSRYALQAGDVLNTYEINRAQVQLVNLGAPLYMGTEQTDEELDAGRDAHKRAVKQPSPHYVAICHPFVQGDLRNNATFIQSSSYSDINKLYGSEFGQWAGTRFVACNLVPFWTGLALVTGTPSASGGSLATSTTYNIIVTYSDIQNQYESQLCQVSGNISVTGSTGSISVVIPALAGYTANVYIGTTSSPANLAACSAGPTQGPFMGMATQLATGQTVTLTAIGVAQTPPAPVATGVTVYPTYIFGKGGYSQVVLSDIQIVLLTGPDKADPLNQLREIGWKVFYGTLLKNVLFMLRVESASAFSSTFG